MPLTRRQAIVSSIAALTAAPGMAAAARLGDDGLHKQDWLLDSFLELPGDLAEARSAGKGLVVMFEQRGCPYCREMHSVNFARPEIVDYATAHFDILQLDLWGSREVTDFDGEALEERRLARKWAVNFTPTLVFFGKDADAASGKPGNAIASAVMPGYFKPFHFLSMFEYVGDGHAGSEPFQRFLQEKIAAMREKGIDPEVW
ncbi:MAG: thioredoxin family protein [Flavobacteriaceae bacterium]